MNNKLFVSCISLCAIMSILLFLIIYFNDGSVSELIFSQESGFSDEAKAVWNRGYEIPDYNVDKCTIVRAVYYDGKGNPSEVKSATYFVGYNEKEGYDNMKVISLITDPDNLFGYENGIYVTGKTFDDEGTDNNMWWSWPANYKQKGKEWERPVTVQFFGTIRNYSTVKIAV